jgi:hypothetical protein
VLASGVGVLVFGGGAWLLRVREPFTMLSWGLAKVRGRLKPKLLKPTS